MNSATHRIISLLEHSFVLLLLLTGSTLLKVAVGQGPLTLWAALVATAIAVCLGRMRLFFIKFLGLLLFFFAHQLLHALLDPNYAIWSSQLLLFVLSIYMGYLAANMFYNREFDFVSIYNFWLRIFIVHALLVVLVQVVHPGTSFPNLIDEHKHWRGIHPLLAVSVLVDYTGSELPANLFGLGLERAHGIFTEPSVFVNYVALFLFLNLFVKFNKINLVLGAVAILAAWSSTGLMLLLFLAVSFVLFSGRALRTRYPKLYPRLRLFLLVLGVPALLLMVQQNMSVSSYGQEIKQGSVSQRYYDTYAAVLAIVDAPLLGSGLNLNQFTEALTREEHMRIIDQTLGQWSLVTKDEAQFSNSSLRVVVTFGLPVAALLFFGLWRQRLFPRAHNKVLFGLVLLGTMASTVLWHGFYLPLMFTGLIMPRNGTAIKK